MSSNIPDSTNRQAAYAVRHQQLMEKLSLDAPKDGVGSFLTIIFKNAYSTKVLAAIVFLVVAFHAGSRRGDSEILEGIDSRFEALVSRVDRSIELQTKQVDDAQERIKELLDDAKHVQITRTSHDPRVSGEVWFKLTERQAQSLLDRGILSTGGVYALSDEQFNKLELLGSYEEDPEPTPVNFVPVHQRRDSPAQTQDPARPFPDSSAPEPEPR